MNPASPFLVVSLGFTVACGGSSTDSAGSKTSGTTGSATDTADGGETIEAIYPTDAMNRVLFYYGSGGYEPESSKASFDDLEAQLDASFGWNVDHRDEWTEDLSAHRMVGLVALGHTGGENLTSSQVEDLRTALSNGTRVVFFADRESCASPVMADALSQLGSTMLYTGEAAGQNARVDATELGTHQLTDGLSRVVFKEPCWVNSTGGLRVVNHNDFVVVSAQRPATGGDIVIIGDFQVLDDSDYLTDETSDNMTFAERLAKVDPSL